MYGCESWTIKKVERQRIDAFELWCWRGLLRVPWTVRRSDQAILKEIGPKYSLEGLMLKLKLQYLSSPDTKNWLIGKDPDAGKDWRREEKGMTEDEMVGWHHRLDGVWVSSRSWWWTGKPVHKSRMRIIQYIPSSPRIRIQFSQPVPMLFHWASTPGKNKDAEGGSGVLGDMTKCLHPGSAQLNILHEDAVDIHNTNKSWVMKL